MTPRLDINALVGEGIRTIRGSYILLVPSMSAIVMSFITYMVLFSALDPELFKDLEKFAFSKEAQQRALIGAAAFSVLTVFAMGVTTAMARNLMETGRTSLDVARSFIMIRPSALLAVSLIIGLSIIIGFTVVLLPGILAAFMFMFSMPALVMGPGEPLSAVIKGLRVVTENLRDSFFLFVSIASMYFLLNIILLMLVFIPVIGVLAAFVLTSAFMSATSIVTLRAYIIFTAEKQPNAAGWPPPKR